jgi:hypothetical protein
MCGVTLMIQKFRIWPIMWLVIALLITAFSFAGGDKSILAGWLFLVWTVPFGMIWWFFLYDYVHTLIYLPAATMQIMGELLSVAVAYIFWFVLIPWIRTVRKK